MLIELMKMITNTGLCPQNGKTDERFYYTKMEKEITPGIGDKKQLQVSYREQYFVE
jgi:hypothetical protein